MTCESRKSLCIQANSSCHWEVEYVGYQLGWEEYSPIHEKMTSIRNLPMPEQPTLKDIRAWHSLVKPGTLHDDHAGDDALYRIVKEPKREKGIFG